MQITPLVIHAARRLPALTDLFSDAFLVSTVAVVSGGTTTLNCPAPHGLELGSQIAITITDAETPNPLTAAVLNGDGTVTLTTQFDHDLTTTPDVLLAAPWHTTVKLSGFGSALLDGVKQLVSVTSRNTFTVMPSGVIGSVTIDGGEMLLEHLERELVGYHRATVASVTTLTLPTPASITRSYTILNPVVVQNIRVFGTLEIATVIRQYVRDNQEIPARGMHMFIAPVDVKTSRSRSSKTDLISEISVGSDYRLTLVDGFDVIVVIPTERSVSGIAAIDAAQGPVLSAVLGTFFGLKMPRPEICSADPFVSIFEAHSMVAYTHANYFHRYRFQASATLTSADAIAPFDWPDVDPETISAVDSVYPIGTSPWRDSELDPGIQHDAMPGKLFGNFKMENTE